MTRWNWPCSMWTVTSAWIKPQTRTARCPASETAMEADPSSGFFETSPFQKYSETKFTQKKENVRTDWATSAYISATFLSSKKRKCFPSAGCKVYQPLKLYRLPSLPLAVNQPSCPRTCNYVVARLCTLMFTRLKESLIKNHRKEYSDWNNLRTALSRELHLLWFACTSVTSAECAVIMKRCLRFFFWLELVASILNTDIKINEKELEPDSESWKHFYNNLKNKLY